MLFSSSYYILYFFPLVFFLFHFIYNKSIKYGLLWLLIASVFYYGFYNPLFLWVIVASIVFNYWIGFLLTKKNKLLLIIGISVNLFFLGYFKYYNFFIDNIFFLSGFSISHLKVVLPLGISFFTFQQIAYLIDIYTGKTKEVHFIDYSLFVVFFPQLIAGPIVHHRFIMPQFRNIGKINKENIINGLNIFFIGLFKKIVIADSIGAYSDRVFNVAAKGIHLSMIESWAGAFAYSFQIYFDFSGYTDMAIGSALLFNIIIPRNFLSPYKSSSIIEFWRKWHVTLSDFLRDYLYIPLGGNRKGVFRRHINLMITMLIGGLWHGAGWTFVIWGALHGFYLILNHGYRKLRRVYFQEYDLLETRVGKPVSVLITFLLVTIAWVFFRSEDLSAASSMLSSMFNFSDPGISAWIASWDSFNLYISNLNTYDIFSILLKGNFSPPKIQYIIDFFIYIWLFFLFTIVWASPATTDLIEKVNRQKTLPRIGFQFFYGIVIFIALFQTLYQSSDMIKFIYYQF